MEKYFETELGYIVNGDALIVMKELVDMGVRFDAIISDIPQKITKNDWDRPIPLKPMWELLYKLRKDKSTPIILFTNQPFTTDLINSNRKHFKFLRYWEKSRPSNFLNARKQPLRNIEEIAFFYESQPIYNPQFFEGNPLHGMGTKYKTKKVYKNNNYGSFASNKNPSADREGDIYKYPRQLMKYKSPHPLHPTQKPLDLVKELVLTYTNELDIILDFTAGSMTTGLACEETNRRWVCIEKEKEICDIGVKRFLK